jgi:hypothetical protein
VALSIFTDNAKPPAEKDLAETLGVNYKLWKELIVYVIKEYPAAEEEWKYGGKNYGWGFRLNEKKRVIIYMTPCDKYFLASLVFGEKATNESLESGISDEIKKIISSAKVYGEGRGFRVEVKSSKQLADIKKLVKIKLKY